MIGKTGMLVDIKPINKGIARIWKHGGRMLQGLTIKTEFENLKKVDTD